MTALTLYPYDSSKRPAVTIFSRYDCLGKLARFYAPTDYGIAAEYSKEEMIDRGIKDNTASSLMVPYGLTVELYRGSTFNDEHIPVVGP